MNKRLTMEAIGSRVIVKALWRYQESIACACVDMADFAANRM